MALALTRAQLESYDRDGIVFPIPVLSAQEVDSFRLACDELESRLGGRPRTVEVRQMHLHFPWAHALATHPRILDPVQDLLGPNLLIWATELFAKHPHDSTVKIGWHQDKTYMGFDPRTTTTAWVALSESTPANGCMRAVPGPQRCEPGYGCPRPIEGDGVVDVVLQSGEMSIHDDHILHGSGSNLSATKRVGFVIRYANLDALAFAGRAPVVVARGRAPGSGSCVVDPPIDAEWAGAVAAMKESAGLHLDAMLQTLARSHGAARTLVETTSNPASVP